MNLDKILKDVEEFERVKGKATPGEWEVDNWETTIGLAHEHHPICVVTSRNNKSDAPFIAAAKNFPAETIIRELVEEVKRLREELQRSAERSAERSAKLP